MCQQPEQSNGPGGKEPEELHDTNLDPHVKVDYEKFGADPDRYSKDFVPAWKRFVLFWYIYLTGAVLVLLILGLWISPHAETKAGIFLAIAGGVAFYYLISKCKCPNCSCNVFWSTYLKRWGFSWYKFIESGKCPSCGVKLKNRF